MKTSKKSAKAAKPGKAPKPAKVGKSIKSAAADAAPVRIDIGLDAKARKTIADGLSHFLADSYTLYLKTHNFHWNVTGPMFNSLHAMFMTQYTEQWTALDEIAERIRALGFNAPGSYAQFAKLSSIREEPGVPEAPEAREMIRQLVLGNEAVCRTARATLKTAEAAGDAPTVDLMTQRLNIHEKNAWMLRSLLE